MCRTLATDDQNSNPNVFTVIASHLSSFGLACVQVVSCLPLTLIFKGSDDHHGLATVSKQTEWNGSSQRDKETRSRRYAYQDVHPKKITKLKV